MKKIFWILVLGAVGSAAVAMGLAQASNQKIVQVRVVDN